jgi:hypothetical protein
MNLDRSRTAVDIESLGKLGRSPERSGVNVLRPHMKNIAKVVLSAAR